MTEPSQHEPRTYPAPPPGAPGMAPPPQWPEANEYPAHRPGPAPGLEYAGFWIRFAAYLIDLIPLTIVSILIMLPILNEMGTVFADMPELPRRPTAAQFEAWEREYTQRIAPLMARMYTTSGLLQLVSVVYYVGFWAWRGQTPGMIALGLRILKESDGTKPGLGRSILRYVGFFISMLVLFIGLIWAAFDPRKQGWHDKIAGTVVVKRAG